MKLEIGMYVRTKNKGICKIEGFASTLTDDYIENEKGSLIPKDEITKASHNIIDLIEVGDYVNGEKVSSIQYEGMGFKHIKCVQTICKFDDLDNRFYTETYFNKDIKSIVTKEQFEAMAYKVV